MQKSTSDQCRIKDFVWFHGCMIILYNLTSRFVVGFFAVDRVPAADLTTRHLHICCCELRWFQVKRRKMCTGNLAQAFFGAQFQRVDVFFAQGSLNLSLKLQIVLRRSNCGLYPHLQDRPYFFRRWHIPTISFRHIGIRSKKNLAIPRTDVEISQISSCQKTNGKHHQTTNLRAENTSDSLTDVWWLGPFCPWCPAGPGKMVSTIRKKKTDQSSKAAWGVSWMVKICKVMWWSSSIPGNSVGGLFWMVRSSFQKISALGAKKDHFESNEPRVCSWQKNVSWINRYCWLFKASWPRIIADSQLSVGDYPPTQDPGSSPPGLWYFQLWESQPINLHLPRGILTPGGVDPSYEFLRQLMIAQSDIHTLAQTPYIKKHPKRRKKIPWSWFYWTTRVYFPGSRSKTVKSMVPIDLLMK